MSHTDLATLHATEAERILHEVTQGKVGTKLRQLAEPDARKMSVAQVHVGLALYHQREAQA